MKKQMECPSELRDAFHHKRDLREHPHTCLWVFSSSLATQCSPACVMCAVSGWKHVCGTENKRGTECLKTGSLKWRSLQWSSRAGPAGATVTESCSALLQVQPRVFPCCYSTESLQETLNCELVTARPGAGGKRCG